MGMLGSGLTKEISPQHCQFESLCFWKISMLLCVFNPDKKSYYWASF